MRKRRRRRRKLSTRLVCPHSLVGGGIGGRIGGIMSSHA